MPAVALASTRTAQLPDNWVHGLKHSSAHGTATAARAHGFHHRQTISPCGQRHHTTRSVSHVPTQESTHATASATRMDARALSLLPLHPRGAPHIYSTPPSSRRYMAATPHCSEVDACTCGTSKRRPARPRPASSGQRSDADTPGESQRMTCMHVSRAG